MYKRILLAYDGSASGANALRQSAELARLAGAELHILGIVSTSGGFAIAQAAGPVDVLGMKRKLIEEALAEAAGDADTIAAHPSITIREGDPAAEIVAHARHIKADLVVLGHSDRGKLARWFASSPAATLLQHLPCSLLIAP